MSSIENKSNEDRYEYSRKILNDIIVELFKNILTIEERSLRKRGIKELSMSEIHVIEAIGLGDGRMMSEIAETLDITMGTMTTAISKLEQKGYVQRTKDPRDKRIVIARLTKRGELVFKIHKNFHDEMIDHIMVDLDIDKDEHLITALKNVNEFFLREYGGYNE